jgi:hypothetical protein
MKLIAKKTEEKKWFSEINKSCVLSADELIKIRGGNADENDGPFKK